jgi:putative phosphoesterase
LSAGRALPLRVGLISDTHDLLRPQALEFLRGCGHIVHAGDICSPQVLQVLAGIAPLTAVRGNNDRGDWAQALDEVQLLRLAGVAICVVHDAKQLPVPPAGTRVLVAGHSHRPVVEQRAGVLYVNPGSAGPRRFKLPVSVGELHIAAGGEVSARIVELAV